MSMIMMRYGTPFATPKYMAQLPSQKPSEQVVPPTEDRSNTERLIDAVLAMKVPVSSDDLMRLKGLAYCARQDIEEGKAK